MHYNPLTNTFSEPLSKGAFLPQLIWVVTDRCRHRCPFCFQPKSYGDFPSVYIASTISKLRLLNIQKVDISGGEPLMYPHLFELCDALRAEGIYVTITTMGGATSENSQLVSKHGLFSRMILSIHAGDEKSHDKMTGRPGSFSNILDLTKELIANNCRTVRINTVVTQTLTNKVDQDSLLDLVKRTAPLEWALIEPNPDNTGPNFGSTAISYQAYTEAVEKLRNQITQENLDITLITRSIDNYADYWVLNPDGGLFKHSKRSGYIMERTNINKHSVDFLRKTLEN